MKTTRLAALSALAALLLTSAGSAQAQGRPVPAKFPGWGVQAWWDDLVGYPKDVIAEAFHFSPDGSYYHVQDEGTILRIAVTFHARKAIRRHKIPIDGTGVVQVILDGVPIDPWVNEEHRVVELDFSPGRHTLVLINNSYTANENAALMVVGKCIWGTDRRITFVKAGLPDPH